MTGLEYQVAIVTGAGSRAAGIGIGRAISLVLARAGARVVLVDNNPDWVGVTADMMAREGLGSLTITCDVTSARACQDVVDQAEAHFGRVDILVNNVGIVGPPGTVVDVDLDLWDEAMTVNVKSMVMMSRAAVPAMLRAGGGSIINISSVSGFRGGHPNVFYPTSKGAVIQLTRAMAVHHGRDGIRVNCVAPGMVYTPLVEQRGMTEDLRVARREANLLGTEGDAWDVAEAVRYLAGDGAKWITGVVLPVDGGTSPGDLRKPSPR